MDLIFDYNFLYGNAFDNFFNDLIEAKKCKMSFEILPIPENLRREELIVQLSDRLKKLDTLFETIFDRVDNKLNKIQNTIQDIDKRTHVSRQKIQFIQNDNKKATVLYSHPKFPIDEAGIKDYFDSIFNDKDYSFDDEFKSRLMRKNLDLSDCSPKKINSTHVPFDDDANVKSHFVIFDKKFPVRILFEFWNL